MQNNIDQLIVSLHDASIYDHAVTEISIIETHISWVLLTGDYAYKIKKPIKFSFVDFSTLEKRKFYCHEEMRLNARLAPNLYLGVVAITGSYANPSFNQSDNAIEYAVKMKQFSQQSLLSYLSTQNQLKQHSIDEMAKGVANFHMRIDNTPSNESLGSPEDIHYWVSDNYSQIIASLIDEEDSSNLEKIKNWSDTEYHKKYNQFKQRRENGFVRECHGDMHLGNMAIIEDKVTIFDGIDFNEHLRWIDVISEVAFVSMDLHYRGHSEYANRFINLYLQYTGDYEGLKLLKYYLMYRAIVRAKVALLRIAQKDLSSLKEQAILKEFKSYLALASRYTEKQEIALIITHGLSGSGKSTHTEKLLESLGAVRIRSDVERKRMYGYASTENTQSTLNEGIYAPQSSKETYARLTDLANIILTSGFSVIVDACFLQHEIRQEFYRLAVKLQVAFIILDFQASEEVLKQRIIDRSKDRTDPSEADLAVLYSQLKKHEQLDEQENYNTIVIDTEKELRIHELSTTIENRISESV